MYIYICIYVFISVCVYIYYIYIYIYISCTLKIFSKILGNNGDIILLQNISKENSI